MAVEVIKDSAAVMFKSIFSGHAMYLPYALCSTNLPPFSMPKFVNDHTSPFYSIKPSCINFRNISFDVRLNFFDKAVVEICLVLLSVIFSPENKNYIVGVINAIILVPYIIIKKKSTLYLFDIVRGLVSEIYCYE